MFRIINEIVSFTLDSSRKSTDYTAEHLEQQLNPPASLIKNASCSDDSFSSLNALLINIMLIMTLIWRNWYVACTIIEWLGEKKSGSDEWKWWWKLFLKPL